MRNWSPPSGLDYGRGCAPLLVRLVAARLGPSKPFVSRQQIVFVFALICESEAMEKGEGAGQGTHSVAKMQTTT